ncbi:hypothetical protein [Natrononativus amylolyticus]|uniref:hypothetical protein n=1 Tax=Natrononativus amylolyticus TaxID=2963434 RepID=UPI0020CC1067|nr:hypothetical protein [Natrononativus amylolyticus]
MDVSELPWGSFLVQTIVMFGVLLGFQYVVRGELTLPIAIIAAVGFFLALAATHWYKHRE